MARRYNLVISLLMQFSLGYSYCTMASFLADSKPNIGLANSLSNVFKLVSFYKYYQAHLLSGAPLYYVSDVTVSITVSN